MYRASMLSEHFFGPLPPARADHDGDTFWFRRARLPLLLRAQTLHSGVAAAWIRTCTAKLSGRFVSSPGARVYHADDRPDSADVHRVMGKGVGGGGGEHTKHQL